ncbi:MAG: SAM-dependent methyltransferase [Cyanothece sp. SIO1E1]|nr:SAM-dependent methyltransferase [Cyanothece sp. SIO1E1]
MSVNLNQIIPFGRSRREYELMFNLTDTDRRGRILGCGDGPASFNAEMTALGHSVISIDPIYAFSGPQIEQQFNATVDDVIGQIKATPENWTWSYHQNSEDLRRHRCQVMQQFLADYDRGLAAARYRIAALPDLPFTTAEFDLALCSHLLFLYSDLLSEAFHLASVLELCRVASEVRIFPLLTLNLKFSPYVEPIRRKLSENGFETEIAQVAYELQKGGNKMLRIFQPE